MIVSSKKPLNLAQVKSMSKGFEENKVMHDYLKSFENLSLKDADKLTEEIKSLNSMKIKEEDIIKLVDFLPKDSEAVNKILNHVSLTEDEVNAILSVTSKY